MPNDDIIKVPALIRAGHMIKTLGGVSMTKSIPLTQGKFALVDDDDFERLSKYKWHLNSNGYARRTYWVPPRQKHIYMHQEVVGNLQNNIDHIDHDSLNNCRNNLRECNQSQNQGNERISKNNTSGYKGVYFRNDTQRWASQIMVGRRQISLGSHDTAEEAAKFYDAAAEAYFGEFAMINFPHA